MKTRRPNIRKIAIFPRRLLHAFGQNLAFYAKQAKKMSFTLFYKGKTPLQDIKTASPKSRKIGIFPWFWSKFGNVDIFSFKEKQAKKVCFMIFQKRKTPFQNIKTRGPKSQKILEKKNAFLRYKNKKAKESKNWDYSMVLVKLWQ